MIKSICEYFQRYCNADVATLEMLYPDIQVPFELSYFDLLTGDQTPAHEHESEELFICLYGTVKVITDEIEEQMLEQGQMIHITKLMKHSIINVSNVKSTLISIAWRSDTKSSHCKNIY